MNRLGRHRNDGARISWPTKKHDPELFAAMTRDENGKRLSPKQIESAITRMRIAEIETEVEQDGSPYFPDLEVFEEPGRDVDVPFVTSSTYDTSRGRDVTAPARMRRKPIGYVLGLLSPMRWSLATRICSDLNLGNAPQDDFVQEAGVRVMANLGQYEGRAAFTTWAWPVCKRAMLNYARPFARHRPLPLLEGDLDVIEPDFSDRVDAWVDLKAALSNTRDADLVLLHVFGYTDAEISETNIRMRRLRATKRLKATMGMAA
jgi:DNA-directed RNA polymerase specialized sigma24 family protein